MKKKISACVCDTSTIIRLTKSNVGHCFGRIFETVHIPQAVFDECKDSGSRQTITQDVFNLVQVKKKYYPFQPSTQVNLKL